MRNRDERDWLSQTPMTGVLRLYSNNGSGAVEVSGNPEISLTPVGAVPSQTTCGTSLPASRMPRSVSTRVRSRAPNAKKMIRAKIAGR